MNGGQSRFGESNQNGRPKGFVPTSLFLAMLRKKEMTCGLSVRPEIVQRKDPSIASQL